MSTTKWVIDPTHSEIGFKVKHMMFTNVSGKFSKLYPRKRAYQAYQARQPGGENHIWRALRGVFI